MLDLLLRKKRSPIALDVGADSVKVMQMQHVGGALQVSASGRWRVPDADSGDAGELHDRKAAALREIVRSGGFRGRRVISALSCGQLGVKNVRLGKMPSAELDRAVLDEARQRFEFDVAPDRLKYLQAGEIRQGAETRQEIIMLAIPEDALNEHLRLLSDAGLRPEWIDVEPVALFRTFERFLRRRADEEAVSVVVDIGLSTTRVIVARGRRIVFIKSVDIAGRKFNEAVAKHLNLSYHEASEMRARMMRDHETHMHDGDGEGERDNVHWSVHDALRAEAEALAREISLCLRYCLVTFRGLRPRCVTMTGGQAYDPALVDLLARNLNLECVVGRPLKNVDVSGVELGSDRRAVMSEWAVCAGLALRDMNIRAPEHEDENAEHRLSA